MPDELDIPVPLGEVAYVRLRVVAYVNDPWAGLMAHGVPVTRGGYPAEVQGARGAYIEVPAAVLVSVRIVGAEQLIP